MGKTLMDAEQLTLSVQLPDDETFHSFHTLNNEAALKQLTHFITTPYDNDNAIKSLYLFGLSGVGKSHLLHASCAYATEKKLTSVCLSFSELKDLSVELLEGLEYIDLVCLDNVDLIVGNNKWEQAIFDLFNRLIEHNKKIIISGNDSVSHMNFSLPDLASRLRWGYTEQIKPMQDEDKLGVIQYRAQQRGLSLPDEVAKFLLNRTSRNMVDLIKALDTLDKASIKQQRKITIPFIKDILL